MAEAHGQCVITGGSATAFDTKTGADADEQGPYQRCCQGIGSDFGEERRELLKESIAGGVAQNGDGRVSQKTSAKCSPPQGIAGDVQHQGAEGRGNVKPMLNQQGGTQNTTFGDIGKSVDIIDAKGLKEACQDNDDAVG